MLYDAPIALVIYQADGEGFTTDKGSLELIKNVDRHMHKIEKEKIGETSEMCDIEAELMVVSEYKPEDHFKNEHHHVTKNKKAVRVFSELICIQIMFYF